MIMDYVIKMSAPYDQAEIKNNLFRYADPECPWKPGCIGRTGCRSCVLTASQSTARRCKLDPNLKAPGCQRFNLMKRILLST